MNTQELVRETVTVAQIFPPAEAGKGARIKGTEGQMYGLWPDKLHLVQPGHTYELGYVTKGVFRNVQTVKEVPTPKPEPKPQSNGHSAGAPNGNGNYRPTSPKDAKRMFLCSATTAFIKTGRVERDTQAVIDTINMLADAYAQTIGVED